MAAGQTYYTKDHEWMRIRDKTAYVGKTEYGLKDLGDVILVDLPPKNRAVSAGDEIAHLEGVKGTAGVSAPCNGVVAFVNEALLDRPETLNTAAADTYIVALRSEKQIRTAPLMNAAAYAEYLAFLRDIRE